MHKAVATVGLGLVLIGLVFTGVISVIQEWVNATVPPIEACNESPVGKLGLYKSTFDPKCVLEDPDAPASLKLGYERFTTSEMSTTEFWPLFPSQTGFGGAFGEIEFESCESFYGEDSESMKALKDGVRAVVDDGFRRSDAGLNTAYTGLAAQIALAFTKVDEAVAGLWVEQLGSNLIRIYSTLEATLTAEKGGAIGGFQGIETLINAILQGGAAGLFAPDTTSLVYTNVRASGLTDTVNEGGSDPKVGLKRMCPGCSSPFDLIALAVPKVLTAVPDSLVQLFSLLDTGIAASTAVGNSCPDYDAPSPECQEFVLDRCGAQVTPAECESELAAGFTRLKSFAGAILSFDLCQGDAKMDDCLFGGVVKRNNSDLATVLDVNFIASEFNTFLGIVLAGTDPADETFALLTTAKFLLDTCAAASMETGQACSQLFTGLPQNFTAPWDLCTFAAASETINKDGLLVPGCSAIDTINVLGQSPALLKSIPEELLESVPALLNAIQGCASANLSLEECESLLDGTFYSGSLDMAQNRVPEDFDDLFALCLGVKIKAPGAACDTFTDFITLASQSPEQAALRQFYDGVVKPCTDAGITNRAECRDHIVEINTKSALTNFIDGKNAQERIAECKDDEEDRRRIALAQVLVPVSIAASGLSLIVGLISVLKSSVKGVLASSAFALLACACVLSGLLLVRTAPVYEQVGKECEEYEPCYEAGIASTLAYVCIVGPLVGGLCLGFSTLCRRAGARVNQKSADLSTPQLEQMF